MNDETEFLAKLDLGRCRDDASLLDGCIPFWQEGTRRARHVIWSGWGVAVSSTATTGYLVYLATLCSFYGRLLAVVLAMVCAALAVYAVFDTRKWRREARFRASVRDALIRMREEKEGAR